jgi:hypothetical protein
LNMPQERARQKRLEKKRRRRAARLQERRGDPAPLPLMPAMSETLRRFAMPLLDRLDDEPDAEAWNMVLGFAAFVWNAATRGEDVDEETIAFGRQLFAELGWTDDPVDQANQLRDRKVALFGDEQWIILNVETALDGDIMRVFALSALA